MDFKVFWRKYYKPFYRVTAFVVAGAAMVVSFPNFGGSNYTYEVHRPWRHGDLIAAQDYPIYKTEDVVAAERDSIAKNSLPYYERVDVDSVSLALEVEKLVGGNEERLRMICPVGVSFDELLGVVFGVLNAELQVVYGVGIVALPENVVGGSDYEMMVVSGNIQEPYALGELRTVGEAYLEVSERLRGALRDRFGSGGEWVNLVVERLPINDIIRANITYNGERTQKELEQRMLSLSLFSGKILAGQKIISMGEIVDREKAVLIDSINRANMLRLDDSGRNFSIYLGQSVLVFCLLGTLYVFLSFFRHDVFLKLSNINFILILISAFVVLTGFVASRHGNISYIIPYVAIPIIVRIFLDSRLAMYVHVITILMISSMAHNSQLFIMLHIPAGMVAISSLVNLTRRGQLVRTSGLVFLIYVLIYCSYSCWQSGSWEGISVNTIVMLGINCMLLLLCYPLIYVFEKMFGFVSDVTLVELTDTNSGLLRELAEKAPGTFQHSVQVGNLAQEVARRVDADTLLVRTGALYHDVGKLLAPMYFTENQSRMNPHEGMDYVESAQIVIGHVENGVKLAKKYKLPKKVIDFITTHHGTTVTQYFYISWCNEHKGEEVDVSKFRYPGPMPHTKEQAIVMMSDSVEAASKSLKSYNDEEIDRLVETIVDRQTYESKQFNKCPLTFRDIDTAKMVFKEKLKSIYHSRVQYPERK